MSKALELDAHPVQAPTIEQLWKKYSTIQRRAQQRPASKKAQVIELSDDDEEDEAPPSNVPTTYPTPMLSAGRPTETSSNTAMKTRMKMLEMNLKKVQDSEKIAADAAETMHATLEANYRRGQETQDIMMKESMDTMERSITIMMTQIQESNAW